MHSCLTLRKDTCRPVWGSSAIQLVEAAHDRASTPGQQRERDPSNMVQISIPEHRLAD